MKARTLFALKALVALAMAGACPLLWVQPAFGDAGYKASNISSDKLLGNMVYLEYTNTPTAFEDMDIQASNGRVVALSGLPTTERNGVGGDNLARLKEGRPIRENADKVCYITPSLWANPYTADMTAVPYPGDSSDAWAFLSTSASANNGAAGASFTVTWRKAALLRNANSTSAEGTLVDIRMKTTFVNTTTKPRFSAGDKAIFQFTDDFAKGFFSFGPTVWDQQITFLDSATGQEVNIQGSLGVVNNSLDEGEGFTVQGATAGFVSNDAPHLSNKIGTPVAGLPASLQASAVPGTYVYEIDEGGALGYIGIGNQGNSIVQAATGNSDDTLRYVDNRFASPKSWKVGASRGSSTHSYQWRSGGVSVPMSGGTVAMREYSIAYLGWPGSSSDIPAGVPTNIGAATNNLANPSLDRNSSVQNSSTNAGTRYYNIDFGALYGLQPPAPVKSVEDHDALGIGDAISFSVDQEVNTYPDNIADPYVSFGITDTLDPALAYESAEMVYLAPGSNTEVPLPDSVGTLSVEGNTVTYTFADSYLSPEDMAAQADARTAMVYRGGTYRLKIHARIALDDTTQISNKALSNINGIEKESNPVPVLVDTAALRVGKQVDFEHAVDDEAAYTIIVENTEEGSVAANVAVTDASLPAEMEYVEGSLEVSGVPETVQVRTVANSQASTSERNNRVDASFDGGKLAVAIAYLPADTPAAISFKVRCTEGQNGQFVPNTVLASLANPAQDMPGSVEASDSLWVNSAKLSVLKRADAFEYRVGDTASYTLSLANTAQGTIAKNVVVTDALETESMEIDFGSIKVEGVPEAVGYPVDSADAHELERRDNAYTLKQEDGGFSLAIPYLPSDALVTVTYTATCTKDSNGIDAANSAKAILDNPLPGSPVPIVSQDSVWTNDAVLTLSKQADVYETQVGEPVHYTLSLANIATGTVAKNVVLADATLPEGMVLDPQSISVEGMPEHVDYPIDGEGEHATEQRENAHACEVEGNGFTLRIDYLPAGTPVKISYTATPTGPVNGCEVVNTATLSADNVLDGEKLTASARIWVNTAQLAVAKEVLEPAVSYRQGDVVTFRVTMRNTVEGTIARNVQLDDSFLTPGLQLVRQSVAAFDAEGSMLSGAQVTQTLDSANFSVALHEDLVCPTGNYRIWEMAQEAQGGTMNPEKAEVQQSIVVEYQAVVTSAALSGKQVQNRATAKADNAEPVDSDAQIDIMALEGSPEMARLNVRYVDEAGPLLDAYGNQIPAGPYSTRQKDFEGYTFVCMGENSAPAQGNAAAGDEVEVEYVYRKITDTPAPQQPEPASNSDPSPAAGKEPAEGNSSGKSAMVKTGDYMKAHPLVATAALAALGAGIAYRMQHARRQKMRKRVLR